MHQAQSLSLRIETLRGGFVESISQVRAVLLGPGADGPETLLAKSGDVQQPVFWRSAAKFVQALSLFASGAVERFELTDAEIAIACASHSGSEVHVALVEQLLLRIGARVEDLHCGPHLPLGSREAKELLARGESPTKLHNNCSGKHTGMLAVCLARGWPLADYTRISHPLQQEILHNLSTVSEVPLAQIQTAVDGCGAVVFRTPLIGMARAYRRLLGGALPEPFQTAGERIVRALRAAPEMVAGVGRLCTDLIRETDGRVIGKIGADGVYGLGSASATGFGLALKIEDGNSKLIEPVLCLLAAHLGLFSKAELEKLRSHWEMPIVNHQGERVGEVIVRVD